MHAIFARLPALQPQLKQIEDVILQYDIGPPQMHLNGTSGQLVVMHAAERAYGIEWYAQVEDETDDRPGTAAVCAALTSEDNLVELTWHLNGNEFEIYVQIPEADGVMVFARHYRDVLERASGTCSMDEGFEIIKSMAALVAKG